MARSGDVGVAGAPERGYWIGPLCAVVGVLGFSFKAILIKLAYAWSPIDAVTLLALRMIYAAPMFAVMAMLAARRPDAKPISKRDWLALAWLDFIGLQYITASLERLVLFLYPTIVVVLSALFLRRPITRKAVGALLLCYAGIGLVFWHDLKVTGDPASTALGGALVFASAVGYAIYLVGAGGVIARLGSLRFIALAMLISAGFVIAQFVAMRPWSALAAPFRVQMLTLAMAIFSTVLPTWLIAESIRRVGANAASLVGSLGPVFTIGLGALILGEPIHLVQLAGAALVLIGVVLVSRR